MTRLTAAERQKRYREKHPDKVKAAKKAYKEKNKGKIKQSPAGTAGTPAYKKYRDSEKYRKTHNNYQMKTKYGITYDEYLKMFNEQGGVCKICKTLKFRKSQTRRELRPLFIDHCHETNKVRGLLCSQCNFGIGAFEEKEETLLEAIKYLKEN